MIQCRRVVLVLALSVAATACDVVRIGAPGATHVDGTENQPGPGEVLVEGVPPRATRPLVIEFVALPEGFVIEAQTARIPNGGAIEASLINLPGPVSLRVNGVPCEGTFTIASERLTHVVMHADEAGCSVETTKLEPM